MAERAPTAAATAVCAVTPGTTRTGTSCQAGSEATSATAVAMANTPGSLEDTTATRAPRDGPGRERTRRVRIRRDCRLACTRCPGRGVSRFEVGRVADEGRWRRQFWHGPPGWSSCRGQDRDRRRRPHRNHSHPAADGLLRPPGTTIIEKYGTSEPDPRRPPVAPAVPTSMPARHTRPRRAVPRPLNSAWW